MDLTLKGTCENLKELSKNLKLKQKCENFLSLSEEYYIEENVKVKKPKLKEIREVSEPEKPKYSSMKVSFLLLACLFVSLCLLILIETPWVILGIIEGIIMFFLFYSMIVLGKKEEQYSKEKEEYEKFFKENKENKVYNDKYPQLIEEYNKLLNDCQENYRLRRKECDANLSKAKIIISKFEGIIAPKFYDNIDDIIEILEDGRADSLKEAINLFVSDSRQKDLVKEQQKMNEIAEQQMWDAQRHNREMEQQAKRQADAVKQQEEARRRGAPNCWQCKNWPCGGDPAYCGSFVKKQ